MHRLICTFVVRIWPKQVFSWRSTFVLCLFHIFFYFWCYSLSWLFHYFLTSQSSTWGETYISDENNIWPWETCAAMAVKDEDWATSWQNQQNGMCAQRRLRSAWASTQSDQSLRCTHEESLGPKLGIQHTAKTLIRLGGCPGWSESSLGAHAILLVLSWGGSSNKKSVPLTTWP